MSYMAAYETGRCAYEWKVVKALVITITKTNKIEKRQSSDGLPWNVMSNSSNSSWVRELPLNAILLKTDVKSLTHKQQTKTLLIKSTAFAASVVIVQCSCFETLKQPVGMERILASVWATAAPPLSDKGVKKEKNKTLRWIIASICIKYSYECMYICMYEKCKICTYATFI